MTNNVNAAPAPIVAIEADPFYVRRALACAEQGRCVGWMPDSPDRALEACVAAGAVTLSDGYRFRSRLSLTRAGRAFLVNML